MPSDDLADLDFFLSDHNPEDTATRPSSDQDLCHTSQLKLESEKLLPSPATSPQELTKIHPSIKVARELCHDAQHRAQRRLSSDEANAFVLIATTFLQTQRKTIDFGTTTGTNLGFLYAGVRTWRLWRPILSATLAPRYRGDPFPIPLGGLQLQTSLLRAGIRLWCYSRIGLAGGFVVGLAVAASPFPKYVTLIQRFGDPRLRKWMEDVKRCKIEYKKCTDHRYL